MQPSWRGSWCLRCSATRRIRADLNVFTTLRKEDQETAYTALRAQVLAYDRKYGYRGPEAFIELHADPAVREQRIEDALIEAIDSPNLVPAVVLEASPAAVKADRARRSTIEIKAEGLRFAAPSLSPKAQPNRKIVPGAVIRVTRDDKGIWQIVQLPQVEAAFVAAEFEGWTSQGLWSAGSTST